MRFAIIGIGNIAPIHAAAILVGVPGAELVAVPHDRKTEAALSRPSTAARGTPITGRGAAGACAGRYRHHLHPAADLHAPMTLAAAQAGAHVLVRETDGAQHSRVRCDDRRL